MDYRIPKPYRKKRLRDYKEHHNGNISFYYFINHIFALLGI